MSSEQRPHDDAHGEGAGEPVPLTLTVVVAQLDVTDADEALRALSGLLLDAEAVTVDFPEALRSREQRYPTGLPTPIPTAIPHADPQHVLTPGLALATLARPVAFGEMGGTGSTVDARLVVMPLLTDAGQHLAALQRLMGLLRDGAAVTDLLEATDEETLRERAGIRLRGAGEGAA
ncbi:PTS sugar transporter subunit IIA [Brachybacterium sacelli]|uniref:PTS system galactitol-specific IIA component n=1 Tax=Brachybacterium sacelli TaxID=173364 RepID=A0ABS4X0G2_9MICO|nr:PTS sugar transporter subunit IIA [Brachybacterium sacelli]MBP2381204.1 PTS system galactitol-specific IIA component [Brachybacterium sacelli]